MDFVVCSNVGKDFQEVSQTIVCVTRIDVGS